MRSVSVYVLLVVLFGCHQVAKAQKQVQVEEPVQKHAPTLIKGKVVDQDGAAVEGAVVGIKLTAFDGASRDWTDLLDQKLTSDENGEFRIPVEKSVAEKVDLYLNWSIGSEVHFRRNFHSNGDKLWREIVELGPLTITKGVRVTGQLISPDSDVELRDPVVNFVATTPGISTFYRSGNCDDEGRFSCVVPDGCKLKIATAAGNFAFSESEHKIEAPAGGGADEIPHVDLGELPLKRGVSVVGSATLRNGRPASGIVVAIVEGNEKGLLHISSAKTDSKGKFELPPHLGKCRIYVLKSCRTRSVKNGETETLKSDGDVPFFDPVDLDLDGKGPELTVDLEETESLTVSGFIYDAKGKPLAGQSVGYGWGSQDGDYGMEGALEMDYVKTNAKGKYEFQFGKGRMLYLQMSNPDLSNAGYEFFVTKKTAFVCSDLFSNASPKKLDDIEFNKIVQDVADLNWEVRQTRSSSALGRASELLDSLFD